MNIYLQVVRCALFGLTLSVSQLSAQVDLVKDVDPSGDPNVQPYADTPVEGYMIVWSDEFNGTEIYGNKWYYRTDSKLWSTQLPANNTFSDGLYHIHGRKQQAQGKEYTGGGMISKKLFKYGYYETRMKVPSGEGWHTSFWMMRHVELRDVPVDGRHIELDVVENDSSDLYHYQTDAHTWRPGSHKKYGTKQIITKDPLDQFHVYGMEFTPTTLRYFFNGELVSETDASEFEHSAVNIWLTCLAGKLGKKTEKVDETMLPALAQYDYVRFFQRESADLKIVQPVESELTVKVGECLDLVGKVTPSGPDVETVVLWSKIWGRGDSVTFDDEYSAKTTAHFAKPGKFIIECSVTVGSVTKNERVTVTVK
ncbi:MAG: glycoside hydrolase family 16 protein [Opitutaceae bacterium]